MTVKLLLLKSGEDLISDIQEMVVGEEDSRRVVGYFLNKPCSVKLLSKSEEDASFQVSLYPWMPLTADEIIPIPSDWVVTITEPIEKVKNLYLEDVLKNGKSADQSSDSDESNQSNHGD